MHAAVAQKTTSALAFDRAAGFYRLLLNWLRREAPNCRSKTRTCGCTGQCGRPAEAAQAYLDVPSRNAAHSLEFKRRAAQQLLMGGHIKESGTDSSVLRLLAYASGRPKRALISLLMKRLQILCVVSISPSAMPAK